MLIIGFAQALESVTLANEIECPIIYLFHIMKQQTILSVNSGVIRMKTIYVAGPLTPTSGHPAITYLDNVRKLIRTSTILLKNGYAPFCPALDYNFFLSLQDGEHISEENIKAYSMEWLERCDIILAIGMSHGVQKEIERAAHLGIPIYYDIQTLMASEGI